MVGVAVVGLTINVCDRLSSSRVALSVSTIILRVCLALDWRMEFLGRAERTHVFEVMFRVKN